MENETLYKKVLFLLGYRHDRTCELRVLPLELILFILQQLPFKIITEFTRVGHSGGMGNPALCLSEEKNTLRSESGHMYTAMASTENITVDLIAWEILIADTNAVTGHMRLGMVNAVEKPKFQLDGMFSMFLGNAPEFEYVIFMGGMFCNEEVSKTVQFRDEQLFRGLGGHWKKGDKVGFAFNRSSGTLYHFLNGKYFANHKPSQQIFTGDYYNWSPCFSVGPMNKVSLLPTISFSIDHCR